MRVIGTAGHVDHGKSTLVQALTGTHPDRLKEEREREMTIDLGFAWVTLPEFPPYPAEEIGIVDVPGHRDFIENMLAGVGGIDAALFVVAADEGVMPQTREHLAILDLLQIQGGVIALTKIDLVDDPEWLDLVESELAEAMTGSVLDKAPIVRLSARSGVGIPELKIALAQCLAGRPPRPDLNRPRLPVDRVFTMPGFGSVVTGTLSDGSLNTGEEIEILPTGLRGRVRGLQTHKQKETTAVPGSRTAINISGVSLDQIRRGDVVARPGDYQATQRMDVQFRLLRDVSQPLKHNTEVKLFIGASERLARLRLLGSESLLPGQEGWLQLELNQPVVAVRGDRYILRRPSPGETLGGGQVVDPFPKFRHKRFSSQILEGLEALARGTPGDVLLQALQTLGAGTKKELFSACNLPIQIAEQALGELANAGQVELTTSSSKIQDNDLLMSKALWSQIKNRAIQTAQSYHSSYPLRSGLPREELKSRLKDLTRNSPRLFNIVINRLVEEGELIESGPSVKRPAHAIRFTPQQQRSVDALLARFAAAPYTPPSLKESQVDTNEEIVNALIELGQLISVSQEVLFRRSDYEAMLAQVRQLLQARPTITAAEVRDHFNTSRKYALAFLEHLDAIGVTVREGDARRLKK